MQRLPTVDEQSAIDAFLSNPCQDSYPALFRTLSPVVFRYFRLKGCERSLSEDLTQEVMLSVYVQCRQLRNKDLFRPWLFRIARNAWLQHLRSQSRQYPMDDFVAAEGIHSPGWDPTIAVFVSEWMKGLSPEERELIVLKYVEELEYHEIASVLGIPQGTVQWRVFQLKRKLAARHGASSL